MSDRGSAREVAESAKVARFWLLMFNLAAVLILSSVDMNIVATAVPSITTYFHTVADVGWYSSAFKLSQCSFQFVFGKAYQLFSIKRVFLFANAISIAGSLLCGAATTSTMLIVGRTVAGLGSAGLLSGCFVILVQSTPLRRRPIFTGIMGAVEGLATLSAPLLGGAIVQSIGWRWCFYISAPLGAVALVLTMCCFSDLLKSSDISRLAIREKILQLYLVSNLLFIPAITALFLAIPWAGTKYSWGSGLVIGFIIAFARRSVIAGCIFIICGNSTDSVLEYYLPTYYQIVRGYTHTQSGYMMLSIIYRRFAELIIYTAFSGLAYGIDFSGPQNAVQTVLPVEDVPLDTSIMLFAQSFGPAVAIAIAQVLFVNQLSTNLNGLVRENLVAIDKSLIQTWYLVVALARGTMIGSLRIEWRSMKSRRD
ncbi:major facilitator superfamily domain-containing protein [Aspergillus flavus]|uniref:Major facilitator superfamily domain-containing protein n=1 Tax=Aspergillus flavus (strain ATCC 200026 / FGSC A1120 / IAM 13836 / NRRL 3357 / JCM 12722 / SRRC 167) TaxID=332952 RepID=A0A7U2QYD2_ASPFN|nr:major facilitator superfamily domain-containing protein [Aspergillus flavus]